MTKKHHSVLPKASTTDTLAFTSGVTVSGSYTANFWIEPTGWTASYVILHYTITGSSQQNVYMTYDSSTAQWEYAVSNLAANTTITYNFTYNTGGLQYDSDSVTYTVGGTSNDSASIYSVAASSIPTASIGAMTFTVMNGTNGAYSDSEIYWGILGINPSTQAWCYLDLDGNLVPISAALNNATGHLTKNGVNYANIYHTISDQQWMNLPEITSGRMYLSVGSPCYITTYDTGFAGPNINNSTDPNLDVYFDFIEFTVNSAGYHGNTTRVDGFGFPIQHRVVNKAGDYDQTVGELEAQTRSGLFTEYKNTVPAAFTSLATVQTPYRIVAPIHGSFAAGGANADYFASYCSAYTTQDILAGTNALASDPDTCAAINRHVYTLSNWDVVADYYQAAPANFYAQFWHTYGINGLAYGFCYDDVNNQASYLSVSNPKGFIVRVGW